MARLTQEEKQAVKEAYLFFRPALIILLFIFVLIIAGTINGPKLPEPTVEEEYIPIPYTDTIPHNRPEYIQKPRTDNEILQDIERNTQK